MPSLFPHNRHRFLYEEILEDLPDQALDVLLKDQEEVFFNKGQVIMREGVKPQGVYYIRSGLVKKFSHGFDGREYVFYLSAERELIGHQGLLSEETNPYSASALTDSKLVFIPRKNFLHAMRISKELQQRIIKYLGHEFGVFVHLAKILAQYSVREKTALALLIVNEKFLRGGSLDAVIELSREELASMVGTVKENLVRVLREFKDEGIITTKGQGIVIKDFDALIHISNYFD